MSGLSDSNKQTCPKANDVAEQLHRIVDSDVFAQAEGLVRFLRFTVETALQGKREQLKETTLGIEVFSRGAGFDPRVDPIVRVQARRLRSHLADYYRTTGQADPILIEIPKGSYAPVFRFRNPNDSNASQRKRVAIKGSVVICSAGALMLLAAVWWLPRRVSTISEARTSFRALTHDAGLTAFPALSPNGSLVAFASDRVGRGDLDIYVLSIAGGEPLRLTSHEADDYDPSFSPDGAALVFRSERNGGGIYVMPVLGGESASSPRLLVQGGRRPRYSPDGEWIAYWTGRRHFGGRTYVIPAKGGQPTQIVPEFRAARDPIWTPDGKSLLLIAQGPREELGDWWVVPISGGVPVRTGVAEQAERQKLGHADATGLPHMTDEHAPGGWIQGRNEVTVASPQGEGVSILGAKLSPPAWRAEGFDAITQGPGFHTHPTQISASTMAFSQIRATTDIWLLRGDPTRRTFERELERLTDAHTYSVLRSASADGTAIVYHRMTQAVWQPFFWRRTGGPAGQLVESPADPLRVYPRPGLMYGLSLDGSAVAYGAREGERHVIYSARTVGGEAVKVCAECSGPWDWSHDGRILYTGPAKAGQPRAVGLINPKSFERTELRLSLRQPVWDYKISPDKNWLAIVSSTGVDTRKIWLAPFRPGATVFEHECVGLTDGTGMDVSPRWSPDGQYLYFLSERDSFRCIWAQRLNPERGHPIGTPVEIRHFHKARRSLANVGNPGWNGLAVTKDGILFVQGEMTGNVWLASLP